VTNFLIGIEYRLPAIILALTVHEFSHAYSAYLLGDPTARNMGRMTLNPIRHLDPIGLICIIIFRFGWAKPVPVNPYNFDSVDHKTGMLLTAIAGPLSNIVMCFLGVGMYVVSLLTLGPGVYFTNFMVAFFQINAILAFFNLLPVPPLDGSKVLFGVLPDRFYHYSYSLERYGFVILILMLYAGIPSMVIMPLSQGLINTFLGFYQMFL